MYKRTPYFNSLIPIPKGLTENALALDISDRSVKFFSLSESKDGLSVKQKGQMEIPVGIVQQGALLNVDALAKIIKPAISKNESQFVRMALPEEQAYVFILEVPESTKEEIESVVSLELEKYVPIPAHEAVFGFEIFTKSKNGYLITVHVIDRSILEGYVSLAEKLGLTPTCLELESQSLARLFSTENSNETLMFIDFGSVRSGISVSSGGKLLYTATVDIGGSALTQIIKDTLSVPEAEAESFKRSFGISNEYSNVSVSENLSKAIVNFSLGIKERMSYFSDYMDKFAFIEKPTITKIVVTGGNAALKNIDTALTEAIGIPVVIPDVPGSLMLSDKGRKEFPDSLSFATVAGLALGEYEV